MTGADTMERGAHGHTLVLAGPGSLPALEAALADAAPVWSARDGDHALELLHAEPPAAVVVTQDARGGGLEFVRRVAGVAALREIPILVVADVGLAAAIEAGAADLLRSPGEPGEVRARLEAMLRAARTRRELARLSNEIAPLNELLRQAEARTRAIVHTAQEGILILDLDGGIDELNAAAERMFGQAEADVAGHAFVEELVAPVSRALVAADLAAAAAGAPVAPREIAAEARVGAFPAECHVTRIDTPLGGQLCAFVRDLTRAKQLELELRQAQKLESVGRLAAGIAHELNTPIQYIGDNARFLSTAVESAARMIAASRAALEARAPEALGALDALGEELDLAWTLEEAPKAAARALQGVERVATIVRAMKEFAHPDQKEMAAVDLNRALAATLEVARNEYKHLAEVETSFGDLPAVTCHASEVNQVFLNLIVNAAHAIGDVVKDRGGLGRITIVTRREGDAVDVAVSDTGPGIPAAIRERVFDPFFTTKEVGRGTGQGLAIARSVVTKHRGTLWFDTTEGKGTTFFVRLPIAQPARGVAAP